jgi:23S rRNA pseudouridine1911/1915/1917 synthase
MQSYILKAKVKSQAKRLDLFLAQHFKDKFSRRFIQQLLFKGNVLVNGNKAKANYRLKKDDEVFIRIPKQDKFSIKPQDLPLDIIYEDDDLLVVNKPHGMVVHPAPGNYSNTLVNALVFHCQSLSEINKPDRPGIVHRLDKDTSGLLLVAKNNQAHIRLSEQFKSHNIRRRYLALVHGIVEFDEGQINIPIGRDPRMREKMMITFRKSREAKTIYRVVKRLKQMTLLELIPETGRTHQLRVHLAYLGHPILGDKKYGRKQDRCRLALHAKSIGFMHPKTGKFMEFDSELPSEVKLLIKSQA